MVAFGFPRGGVAFFDVHVEVLAFPDLPVPLAAVEVLLFLFWGPPGSSTSPFVRLRPRSRFACSVRHILIYSQDEGMDYLECACAGITWTTKHNDQFFRLHHVFNVSLCRKQVTY